MYCQHCGVKLSDDSLFCESCGRPVVEENAVEGHVQKSIEVTDTYESITEKPVQHKTLQKEVPILSSNDIPNKIERFKLLSIILGVDLLLLVFVFALTDRFFVYNDTWLPLISILASAILSRRMSKAGPILRIVCILINGHILYYFGRIFILLVMDISYLNFIYLLISLFSLVASLASLYLIVLILKNGKIALNRTDL